MKKESKSSVCARAAVSPSWQIHELGRFVHSLTNPYEPIRKLAVKQPHIWNIMEFHAQLYFPEQVD